MTTTRAFAIAGWGLALLGVIGTVVVRIAAPAPFLPTAFGFGPAAMVAFLTMGLSWASIGAFLVLRRPENVVGRIMVVAGAGYALSMLCVALTFALAADASADGRRLSVYAAWATVLFQQFGTIALLIAFVFPTGQAHTPRWARVTRASWLLIIAYSAVVLLQPGPLHLSPTIENPFGFGPDLRAGQPVSPLIEILAVFAVAVVVLSLATRYRMSGPTERQQLKWFVLSMVVALIGISLAGWGTLVANGGSDELGLALYAFAAAAVPVAIAVAILRHHLYDIDRIVSNAIGYGLVTLVLFGVFAAVNLIVISNVSVFVNNEGIGVAASTLLVAALFNPVRVRVQRTVDRRFHRAQYDAERMVSEFTAGLRDEVEIGRLQGDIVRIVHRTVAPSGVGLWLRPGSAR
jgi:hypothetical protein